MRVYKFIDLDGGLASIKERRLRISQLNSLNDPFEFLGVDLSDKHRRGALRAMKATLAKSKGILCFSRSWQNPVMWGHCASKHGGLCLGFEMPSMRLSQISYVTSRLTWPDTLSHSFVEKTLLTKFVHWSYEDEYRAWVALDESDNGHYYCEFSNELILKQVLVGAECQLSRTQLSAALNEQEKDVEVFKVRAAFRSFKMVRNRNEILWK